MDEIKLQVPPFFDESLNESKPQEGESNLQQWKTKAILMTHEIKQKGMIAGRRVNCVESPKKNMDSRFQGV